MIFYEFLSILLGRVVNDDLTKILKWKNQMGLLKTLLFFKAMFV